MGIFIDICIVVLLSLSIFLAYRKGLIGVAVKVLSFIIAILIALILAFPISNIIIEHTEIDDKIEESIINRFVQEENSEKQSQGLIAKQIEDYADEVKENSVKIVAQNISRTIINLSVIMAIFVVTRFVLIIFRSVLNKVAKLPIIKQCDKIGGIVYGVLRGFLIIYVTFAIIALTASLFNSSQIISMIYDSFIGKIIYDNNIILKLFF